MKRITTILIIVLLGACRNDIHITKSDCEFKDTYEFNIDSIIAKQVLAENKSVKEYINEKIDLLIMAKQNKSLLFPFSDIDSAVYTCYEKVDEHVFFSFANYLEMRKPKFIIILCKEKIDAMINLVNDPNNFGYGQLGTLTLEAQIKFYKSGKEKAKILFDSCSAQMSCEPLNILMNYGLANETGTMRLHEIAPWK